MDRRDFVKRAGAWAAGAFAYLSSRATPAASAAPLFVDSFDRKARRGWGKPWFNQRYGNKWSIAKRKGVYDLPEPQANAGAFNPNPVLVLDRDVAATDVKALISASNANARFGVIVRAGGYSDYYTAYLDGSTLRIARIAVNKEDELGAAAVPAVAAGKSYWIRLSVSGNAAPASLAAKVWRAGTREPAGQTLSAQDADPPEELLRAAPFGLLFMHDDRERRAVRFKVGRVVATSTDPKATTEPRLTYAFAGRSEREPDGTYKTRLAAKADVPADIVFHVGTNPQLTDFTVVPAAETFAKPITAKASLTGLAAGQTVYWRAVAKSKSGAKSRTTVRSFRTPPEGGQVSFAFGSCSHLYPVARSYLEASQLDPYFFAHLGDFGYAQSEEGATMALRSDSYQDRWIRMLDRFTLRQLHEKAAWLMLQDDHDYGADNATRSTVKPFTIGAWGQMSANFDGGAGYFDTRYGDVHCFFVDVHRYSDEQTVADSPSHSILGADQKAWLKDGMRASTAPLLVLFSPMPFWGLGPGDLTWKRAFAAEGGELLGFLFGLQTPGRRVLVCAGNAHAQYIARHRDPAGGRDIVEFVSSGTDRIQVEAARPIAPDGVIDEQRAIRKIDAFGYVTLQGAGAGRRVILRSVASNPEDLGRNDIWPPLELDL